jgi:signal transduction histidine kinase/CheY-like chemotaxis protein/HPt (histidine-containing phosphotransfer) domain-containing protein
MRQFSIRSLCGLSLLFLVIGPALVMAWLMIQRTQAVVEELASQALQGAVSRGQADIGAHLRQAYRALDGLLPEHSKTSVQTVQAVAWVNDPALFAPMAFALTRASEDLRFVYYRSAGGSVHGVENAVDGFRFGGRGAVDSGARTFSQRMPGVSPKLASADDESLAPRSPWYNAALKTGTRVFSPVTVYPGGRQLELIVTLSQAVYDNAGQLVGVLGADLSLQPLAALLRAQITSPHGIAFLVDEKGFLIASTTDDPVILDKGGQPVLHTPQSSINPLVRASFAALEQRWSGGPENKTKSAGNALRFRMADSHLFAMHASVGDGLGRNWTLIVAAPEGDFGADAGYFLSLVLPGLGVLVLAGLLVTSFGARHIERLFAYLDRSLAQLGNGAIPALSYATPVREFNKLVTNLRDSALQLHENNFDMLSEALVFPDSVMPDGESLEKLQLVEALQAQLAVRTTELAAACDRAMAATRSKAAFLAVTSHELRTPLNGVVGMSTLLANTTLNGEQRDYLQSLCESSSKLQAVVDEILEFSRAESGEIQLENSPFNVRNILEEACDAAARAAYAKGLKLTVDIPGRVRRANGAQTPWVIQGDAARMAQVLGQLVLNAVKFTESGSVTVQVRPVERTSEAVLPMLEVRVRDTGPGIAPDQLQNVFMPFTQLDSSISRKHGGTGLGLATCKRLVELMGGQINVESKPDAGSCFWFTALAPWAESSVISDSSSTADGSRDFYEPLLLGGALQKNAEKLSILVVDDTPINLKVACAMLLKFGYRILTAEGGREAISTVAAALARGEMLGAVLMDVHMPDVDGIQAARSILATHGERAPPIIALTAGSSVDDRQRCLDAGMVEYLTKPLQVSALAKALDHWAKTQAVSIASKESPHEQPEKEKELAATQEPPQFERFSDADISMPAGLVDFDRLNDFKEFDDSQLTMTREVMGLLFSEVPVQLAAIERAILHGDASGLGRAAHSLRGAASNVGAVTVQHLCSVLERGTLELQAVPPDASGCLVALHIAWNRTRPLLENWR